MFVTLVVITRAFSVVWIVDSAPGWKSDSCSFHCCYSCCSIHGCTCGHAHFSYGSAHHGYAVSGRSSAHDWPSRSGSASEHSRFDSGYVRHGNVGSGSSSGHSYSDSSQNCDSVLSRFFAPPLSLACSLGDPW